MHVDSCAEHVACIFSSQLHRDGMTMSFPSSHLFALIVASMLLATAKAQKRKLGLSTQSFFITRRQDQTQAAAFGVQHASFVIICIGSSALEGVPFSVDGGAE